jgi:L-ascorbate metabolism protein UlaG (beta-lactamase superfamily)
VFDRNTYYSGPKSDHFDGVNFFNPNGQKPKNLVEVLKWVLGGGNKKWPKSFPSPIRDQPPERVNGAALRVSFVGHATILLQTEGLNILTDPVWSDRASPFVFAGPKRVNAPGIAFDELPPIDVVLLSHNHYDHFDLRTLSRLKSDHNPLIITPLGNDAILHRHDPGFRIAVGDWGDVVDLGGNISVAFEPAHHWSARGMFDRTNALWAAFVVTTPNGKIYHIGDTGFHDAINFRAAREKHNGFRLALIPFGAYEPRDFMSDQHQNPDEAVQCHKICGAEHTLGHHWGTFKLTNESIEDQLEALAEARITHGVDEQAFRALRPGEVWDIPETVTT